jgi:UPF0716 family protein affecting phage T7 exclusion
MSRVLLSLVLLLFADLALLAWIGRHTSGTFVLAIVIASGAAGVTLLRSATRRHLRAVEANLRAGRSPGESVQAALATLAAAILLIVPGVLTDMLALVLLVPITRRVAGGWLSDRWAGRSALRGFAGSAEGIHDAAGRDRVIDARAVEPPRETPENGVDDA